MNVYEGLLFFLLLLLFMHNRPNRTSFAILETSIVNTHNSHGVLWTLVCTYNIMSSWTILPVAHRIIQSVCGGC